MTQTVEDASKGTLFPIYFVADESGSMSGHINALNEGLIDLVDTLAEDPFAASRARISVLGFDNQVRVRADLMDCREVDRAPRLTAQGGTSFKAAFEDLKTRISPDIDRLKSDGYRVLRPLVFFLTDGYPNSEDWQQTHSDLIQSKRRPNIAAFGLGDADGPTILQIASKPQWAFVADNTMAVGQALTKFMEAFTQSVVQSTTAIGNAEGSGEATVEIEIAQPEGFKLVLDEM